MDTLADIVTLPVVVKMEVPLRLRLLSDTVMLELLLVTPLPDLLPT